MMRARMKRLPQRGVALLEALIAILLLAIGLLGTIGLQARSYSALSEATMRAEATLATEKLVGIIGNDQGNASKYALAPGDAPSAEMEAWVKDLQERVPNAAAAVKVSRSAKVSGWEVDMTITWTRKAGDKPNTHHVLTYITTSL